MPSESAKVVSLEEYRRRRAAESSKPEGAAQPMMMWYPVWVMVPVWPVADRSLGRSFAAGC